MKTIAEMQSLLSSMGIKKRFKPYCEGERDTVLLHVRNPAKIIDGFLVGSEIDLYDSSTFRVWTNQKNKVMATARQYNLKSRLMDGEAELYIPANLADELLPQFGAKVKQNHPGASKEGLDRMRQALNLRKNTCYKALPAAETEKAALDTNCG